MVPDLDQRNRSGRFVSQENTERRKETERRRETGYTSDAAASLSLIVYSSMGVYPLRLPKPNGTDFEIRGKEKERKPARDRRLLDALIDSRCDAATHRAPWCIVKEDFMRQL